jgi:hypothetical protein
LRRKKTSFEIAEICGGFEQIPSFLLLKRVYEGRANPNPLTLKEDDRIDKHLKYYKYRWKTFQEFFFPFAFESTFLHGNYKPPFTKSKH